MENELMLQVNGLRHSTVSSVVAIAMSCNKNNKYVIRWAMENLIPEGGHGKVCFKLLHVFPKIRTVPTPMGNGIPISAVRDDIAAAFRKEVERQTSEKLLPYEMFCIRKKVQVEVVKIESDDIANAISDEIAKCNINKLVIGASSAGGIFSRGQSLSARMSEYCPNFCTVYVVSKGKLSSVRPSKVETIIGDSSRSSDSSSYYTLNFKTEWDVSTTDHDMISRRTDSIDTNEGEDDGISSISSSDISNQKSNDSNIRSLTKENRFLTVDQSSSSSSTNFSPQSPVDINSELEQLRMDFKRLQVCRSSSDTVDASRTESTL